MKNATDNIKNVYCYYAQPFRGIGMDTFLSNDIEEMKGYLCSCLDCMKEWGPVWEFCNKYKIK